LTTWGTKHGEQIFLILFSPSKKMSKRLRTKERNAPVAQLDRATDF
tara:strand:+ start:3286 stop:3423 length:138 start_codon:yes stop_codon:yes gene_type:complete